MGNSIAAEKGLKNTPPELSPEHPAVSNEKGQEKRNQNEQQLQPESHPSENDRLSERGPGSFEDIHRKCKGIKYNHCLLSVPCIVPVMYVRLCYYSDT